MICQKTITCHRYPDGHQACRKSTATLWRRPIRSSYHCFFAVLFLRGNCKAYAILGRVIQDHMSICAGHVFPTATTPSHGLGAASCRGARTCAANASEAHSSSCCMCHGHLPSCPRSHKLRHQAGTLHRHQTAPWDAAEFAHAACRGPS